jgi:glutamate formiminotransferase/formiminotetrahydrofolate cyclodeaminase
VAPFDPQARIIEYVVGQAPNEPLASLSVRNFVQTLGARLPAPGGGSASALIAAMGAALGAMVGWMSYGNRKFEHLDGAMRRLLPPLLSSMESQIPGIDADTDAFTDYMSAMRMPKGTDDEAAIRQAAMQAGLRRAVEVPLETMRKADAAWEAMKEMASLGNLASKSDMQVGARALELGVWGAWQNVRINLEDISDAAYAQQTAAEAAAIHARAEEACKEILDTLEARSSPAVAAQ